VLWIQVQFLEDFSSAMCYSPSDVVYKFKVLLSLAWWCCEYWCVSSMTHVSRRLSAEGIASCAVVSVVCV